MFIYSYIYYFRFFQILTCNSCFISNLEILLLMVSILREQNWWNLCHIFEEKKLHLWYNKPDYTPFFSYTIRAWRVDKKSFSHNLYFWPIRKELSLLRFAPLVKQIKACLWLVGVYLDNVCKLRGRVKMTDKC